jgi:hypothetical protein
MNENNAQILCIFAFKNIEFNYDETDPVSPGKMMIFFAVFSM